MIRVLIIDGEGPASEMLAGCALHLGYDVSTGHTISECLKKVASNPPDVIFIDADCPTEARSISWMRSMPPRHRRRSSSWLTAEQRESAERAIRNGAWDYTRKRLP
jgi:DNA-binding NtrC family response regulator